MFKKKKRKLYMWQVFFSIYVLVSDAVMMSIIAVVTISAAGCTEYGRCGISGMYLTMLWQPVSYIITTDVWNNKNKIKAWTDKKVKSMVATGSW